MADGAMLPITNKFDKFGDDCEDDNEVVTVVAGREEYGWVTVDVTHPLTIH